MHLFEYCFEDSFFLHLNLSLRLILLIEYQLCCCPRHLDISIFHILTPFLNLNSMIEISLHFYSPEVMLQQ